MDKVNGITSGSIELISPYWTISAANDSPKEEPDVLTESRPQEEDPEDVLEEDDAKLRKPQLILSSKPKLILSSKPVVKSLPKKNPESELEPPEPGVLPEDPMWIEIDTFPFRVPAGSLDLSTLGKSSGDEAVGSTVSLGASLADNIKSGTENTSDKVEQKSDLMTLSDSLDPQVSIFHHYDMYMYSSLWDPCQRLKDDSTDHKESTDHKKSPQTENNGARRSSLSQSGAVFCKVGVCVDSIIAYESPEAVMEHWCQEHAKATQCPLCGLKQEEYNYTAYHISSVHVAHVKQLRPPFLYSCLNTGCIVRKMGSQFPSAQQLVAHTQVSHPKDTLCMLCGSIQDAADKLVEHLMTQHADVMSKVKTSATTSRPMKTISSSSNSLCVSTPGDNSVKTSSGGDKPPSLTTTSPSETGKVDAKPNTVEASAISSQKNDKVSAPSGGMPKEANSSPQLSKPQVEPSKFQQPPPPSAFSPAVPLSNFPGSLAREEADLQRRMTHCDVPECSRLNSFENPAMMQVHWHEVHTEWVRHFVCPICEAEEINPSSMTSHMEEKHNIPVQHICRGGIELCLAVEYRRPVSFIAPGNKVPPFNYQEWINGVHRIHPILTLDLKCVILDRARQIGWPFTSNKHSTRSRSRGRSRSRSPHWSRSRSRNRSRWSRSVSRSRSRSRSPDLESRRRWSPDRSNPFHRQGGSHRGRASDWPPGWRGNRQWSPENSMQYSNQRHAPSWSPNTTTFPGWSSSGESRRVDRPRRQKSWNPDNPMPYAGQRSRSPDRESSLWEDQSSRKQRRNSKREPYFRREPSPNFSRLSRKRSRWSSERRSRSRSSSQSGSRSSRSMSRSASGSVDREERDKTQNSRFNAPVSESSSVSKHHQDQAVRASSHPVSESSLDSKHGKLERLEDTKSSRSRETEPDWPHASKSSGAESQDKNADRQKHGSHSVLQATPDSEYSKGKRDRLEMRQCSSEMSDVTRSSHPRSRFVSGSQHQEQKPGGSDFARSSGWHEVHPPSYPDRHVIDRSTGPSSQSMSDSYHREQPDRDTPHQSDHKTPRLPNFLQYREESPVHRRESRRSSHSKSCSSSSSKHREHRSGKRHKETKRRRSSPKRRDSDGSRSSNRQHLDNLEHLFESREPRQKRRENKIDSLIITKETEPSTGSSSRVIKIHNQAGVQITNDYKTSMSCQVPRCNFFCATWTGLLEHWRLNHIEQVHWFVCSVCRKEMQNPDEIKRHMVEVHELSGSIVQDHHVSRSPSLRQSRHYISPDGVDIPPGLQQYISKMINAYKVFTERDFVSIIMDIRQLEETKQREESRDRVHAQVSAFKCGVEGCKSFARSSDLLQHWYLTHEFQIRHFICPVCEVQKETAEEVKSHMVSQHGIPASLIDNDKIGLSIELRSPAGYIDPEDVEPPDGLVDWMTERRRNHKVFTRLVMSRIRDWASNIAKKTQKYDKILSSDSD